MDIELIMANWILDRLKKEDFIDEITIDAVKKKILQNLLGSMEGFKLEDRAA